MKKWLFGIFLANLLGRIALLSWHPATYTDSIYYMTALNTIKGTFILPAYPFAIVLFRKVISDPIIAGRLVSMFFAAAAVFPLYGLARVIYNRRAALITVSFYTVSPLVFRWSIRIFPHGMFSFLVILSMYLLFKFLEKPSSPLISAGIFAAGLAALTYPNGLVLFPLCLFALAACLLSRVIKDRNLAWLLAGGAAGGVLIGAVRAARPVLLDFARPWFNQLMTTFPVVLASGRELWFAVFLVACWFTCWVVLVFLFGGWRAEKGAWFKKPFSLLLLIAGFGSWVFIHIWQKYLAQSWWYQEGMKTSWISAARRWDVWLKHYLESYPYVMTYPVAVLAGAGLLLTLILARRRFGQWLWTVCFLYLFASITFVLVINKWWTPRYQYDLVPLGLVWTGWTIDRLLALRRLKIAGVVLLTLCLLGSLAATAAVMHWSRDSFGDILRTAYFVRDNFPGRSVFSDETMKTAFWSKRHIRPYRQDTVNQLRAGDLVLLHSWHSDLRGERARLSSLYENEIIHKETSTIIPLLADDILRRGANAPEVWRRRFKKQEFESLVVEIKDPRGERAITASSPGLEAVFRPYLTISTEQATYFDVGVWEVLAPVQPGEKVRVEMAHAREGEEGAFSLVVYLNSTGDGFPDRLVAQSPVSQSQEPGQWTAWEFEAPAGRFFVGSTWRLGNWVYYERGRWPDGNLGETMFYSRGGLPRSRAHRFTNLRLSFPTKTPAAD